MSLQRERWILWLPLAMIAGAAGWISAPSDPPVWAPGAIFVLFGGAGAALALWPGGAYAIRAAIAGLCALAAAAGIGALAAEVRTAMARAPAFVGGEEPVVIEGWVAAEEPSEGGPRLRLLVSSVEGVSAPPRYVRVAVSRAGVLSPGRAARCRAVLGAPSGPMAPGAYDFARRAYFERLGAAGFAYGRCRPIALPAPPHWLDRQRVKLAAARADLAAAVREAAPGRGGAVAAALITGDRSGVDDATNAALRDSGLGHLLSVSGIHMGVVGGLVFALLTWTLSLIGPIALRWPVKKLAAIGALAALGAYLLISGTSVPALRSFVMACVAFGAILIDRPAISMRGLALAALVVTLLFPESVLEPGFQMSFAATMALVALFELMRRAPGEPALPTPGPIIGALQAVWRGIAGVLLISLVAGLATDPFAIYHFQRFALYALPANLIAAPIMSFLAAPAAMAAALLAPFGYAEPALQVMASALDLVAAVGQTFGERPEAVRAVAKPPDAAFLLAVLALAWACLWRGVLRWGAIGFLAGAIALAAAAPKPVAAFDGDLRAVFARDAEGWTLVTGRGRSTYVRDRLGAMLGLSPSMLERLAPPARCGEALCTWRTPADIEIILVRQASGFEAACHEDAVVIAREPAPPGFAAHCRPRALLDAQDRAGSGGALIYEAPEGIRIERAWRADVRRAWTPAGAALDQE